MRRHPQLLHLCHLRPAAAIAARCWHHHASLSHEPRGHSHCRARPAWPNRHLVGAHRGHPQPQPDRCACVQCGRWWLGRAAGSRPCAGDVACHGWPVLWRQSSRSAPRPWLRGCLQAAPRDPGSGVRCVYRSSYGYTRVYWSQLPAVGAFGRVWWPWRTMRTQKVAFLTLWDPPRFGNSRGLPASWFVFPFSPPCCCPLAFFFFPPSAPPNSAPRWRRVGSPRAKWRAAATSGLLARATLL